MKFYHPISFPLMNILLVSSCENSGRAYEKFLLDFDEIDTVVSTSTIEECIQAYESGNIDLSIVSVELLGHLEAANDAFIASRVSRPKKVLMATQISGHIVIEAIEHGFNDVISLKLSPGEIMARLFLVASGETNICQMPIQQVMVHLLEDGSKTLLAHDITDLHILHRLAHGKANKEIADEVYLSLQTVRNRISRLMQATEAENRTQLALMFIQG